MTVASVKCINGIFLFTHTWIVVFLLNHTYAAPLSTAVITDWSQYNLREPMGKGTYSFRYDIEDPETNNIQFRSEERHPNGTVIGSYGYLEPDGNIHMVHYIADERGYRASVENSARGGMLKPIPVLEDIDYTAYGYTPQMIAALKSQQNYKKQQVQEQRLRPFDQQSEEQKLQFEPETSKNPLNEHSRPGIPEEQNKLQQQSKRPLTNALSASYPYFNYGHLIGNDEKIEDNIDLFSFA